MAGNPLAHGFQPWTQPSQVSRSHHLTWQSSEGLPASAPHGRLPQGWAWGLILWATGSLTAPKHSFPAQCGSSTLSSSDKGVQQQGVKGRTVTRVSCLGHHLSKGGRDRKPTQTKPLPPRGLPSRCHRSAIRYLDPTKVMLVYSLHSLSHCSPARHRETEPAHSRGWHHTALGALAGHKVNAE